MHLAKRGLINGWLNDAQRKPTVEQLQALSREVHVPFGYFFLDHVPKEDSLLLQRAVSKSLQGKQPSRELVDTVHDMETKQAWFSDYRKVHGYGRNRIAYGYHRVNSRRQLSADNQANAILNALGLKPEWGAKLTVNSAFARLQKALNDVGVTVMFSRFAGGDLLRRLNQNEFRAFVLSDDYAPLIFINSNVGVKAMLFSLTREMVCLWLGASELDNDRFGLNDAGAEQTVRQVTQIVIGPELMSATEPSQNTADDSALSANTALQIDSIFAQAVASSVRALETTYTDAFTLLNVKNTNEFDRLIAKAQTAITR